MSREFIKKLVKFAADPVHQLMMRLGRLVGVIDFPVPPLSSLAKTSSVTVRHYYRSGIRSATPLMTAAEIFGLRLQPGTRVLDFGCGVGRQLLHFTSNYPGLDCTACDVDDTSVEWVKKNYPTVKAETTNFTPPLPFENESFDLIYSVSIFSHLSIEDIASWLPELRRVMRKDGLCLLTIEGPTALKTLATSFGQDYSSLEKELAEVGYLFKDYEDRVQSDADHKWFRRQTRMLGIDRAYGNTVLSPNYIRESWPQHGFEVLAIAEGIIDTRQDLVVLRAN